MPRTNLLDVDFVLSGLFWIRLVGGPAMLDCLEFVLDVVKEYVSRTVACMGGWSSIW